MKFYMSFLNLPWKFYISLVDPLESPYALTSITLEILSIAHYGMAALEVS